LNPTRTKTHPIKHYYSNAPLPRNTILEAKPQRLQHSKENGMKTPFRRLKRLKRDFQTTSHFEEFLTSRDEEVKAPRTLKVLNLSKKTFHSYFSQALERRMYVCNDEIFKSETKPSFYRLKIETRFKTYSSFVKKTTS